MNVRWMAVLTGVVVDTLIGAILALFHDFSGTTDLGRPGEPLVLSISVVLTTLSGYVAGRIARANRVLNGLLVQVVNILLSQFGPPLPRALVIAYAVACLFAALGGFLSRWPPESQTRSSGQR